MKKIERSEFQKSIHITDWIAIVLGITSQNFCSFSAYEFQTNFDHQYGLDQSASSSSPSYYESSPSSAWSTSDTDLTEKQDELDMDVRLHTTFLYL